jgi:hypothetical protein
VVIQRRGANIDPDPPRGHLGRLDLGDPERVQRRSGIDGDGDGG